MTTDALGRLEPRATASLPIAKGAMALLGAMVFVVSLGYGAGLPGKLVLQKLELERRRSAQQQHRRARCGNDFHRHGFSAHGLARLVQYQ